MFKPTTGLTRKPHNLKKMMCRRDIKTLTSCFIYRWNTAKYSIGTLKEMHMRCVKRNGTVQRTQIS